MLLWDQGIVVEILQATPVKQVMLVEAGVHKRKVINYPHLTGMCKIGDRIAINITAVELQLGTGGFDFVIANLSRLPIEGRKPSGHIIKNRYTPLQFPVQCGEEERHPLHPTAFEQQDSILNTPVLILSLHSMLPICVMTIKRFRPNCRIVYVMTDSTSLPLWLSNHVDYLSRTGLLTGTVTYGQAFGGHLEAVNKFSALLLAKHALEADIILIGSGPGSVGTGSKWGFSAIEVGEIVNAVNILSGNPIIVPRISFSDTRSRHIGLSHHILTSLRQIAITPAHLPIPNYQEEWKRYIIRQLEENYIEQHGLHQIYWLPEMKERLVREVLDSYPFPITTMGRGIEEDQAYFQGIMIAANYALPKIRSN